MEPGTESELPRRRRLPAPTLPVLLLLLLGAVNALAVAGVVSARRSAREAALQDLRLQTEGHARALEAVLAGLRRDLLSLVRTPALQQLVAAGAGVDARATAARAAAEQTLVVFLQAHPAVRAAALRDNRGAPLVLAAYRGSAVELLPAASDPPAPIADPDLLVAPFPVASRAREHGLLEAWVDRRILLDRGGARHRCRPRPAHRR